MANVLEAVKFDGSPPPPGVRLAVPADEDALFSMCWAVHGENALFAPSPRKGREELRVAIGRQGGMIGVVEDETSAAPVGMAWLVQHQEWYTDSPCIAERFVFVRPEHRDGTNHAQNLLDWTRWVSAYYGYPLMIGFLSTIRTKSKLRLYRQQFGEPVGHFFLYGAQPHCDAQAGE